MATLGNQMVDRTKVVAAFRKLKRAPEPSDELIDLIVETANDWSDEPPPFNRFFDDDLRKAYANLYRLLRIHAKFWRNTLKSISRRKPQSAFEEAMLADIMDELKPLISDAEIIMKAPAFYHRMSEANLRGKENPRGETPINRMRRNLVELIRTGGYNQAQARRVALYLFPAINVNDPNEALKPALKPQNERQKGNDSAPDPIATGPGAYQLLCCFRHLGSTITASQQVICADARQTIDEPLDVGATYIQTLSHADPRPQFARLHQSFACRPADVQQGTGAQQRARPPLVRRPSRSRKTGLSLSPSCQAICPRVVATTGCSPALRVSALVACPIPRVAVIILSWSFLPTLC